MQLSKIQIVDTDDWQGLYVDGELMLEGHRLSVYDVLNVLGFVNVECPDVDMDLQRCASFPQKFSDLVFE